MKIDGLTHPKTKELSYTLEIPLPHAIGLLELLWAFVAQQTPQGNVGKWSNAVIAGEAGWDKNPDDFVHALVSIGFLDESSGHRLLVHDWADHAPNWVHAKLKKAGKAIISPDLSDDLRGDLREAQDPIPEATTSLAKPSLAKNYGRSAKPPDPLADEFAELWEIYPKRAGSNPKPKALQAYGARRREGVKPEDIRAGLERYAAFCEATDKIGTETVMQAARFFGPGREWENEFDPPLPKIKLPTDSPSLWAIREQYGLDPFYEDLPTCHREIRARMQQHPEIRPPQ